MILNILYFLSPFLHKLYCYIKGISPNRINYRLYQTNVLDYSTNMCVFIFESKYKLRNQNDLKSILKIILNHLEYNTDYYHSYKLTFYEASDTTGFCHNISYPYIFNLKYQLYAEDLYNNINWNNFAFNNKLFNKDIIAILHRV